MTVCISIGNKKGGVAKTMTTTELAYFAGVSGKRVLVVDLDGQAHTTLKLTGSKKHRTTIYDMLVDEREMLRFADCMVPASEYWENVDVLPGDNRLNRADHDLQPRLNREKILRGLLATVKRNYDLILFDLPPATTNVTLNALVASDYYIVPTDMSEDTRRSVQEFVEVADRIRDAKLNSRLEMLFVFLSRYQKGRSAVIKALLKDLEEDWGDKLLDVRVNDSVRAVASTRRHKPLALVDSGCQPARAYEEIAEGVLALL